jgi:hypothetical protein
VDDRAFTPPPWSRRRHPPAAGLAIAAAKDRPRDRQNRHDGRHPGHRSGYRQGGYRRW